MPKNLLRVVLRLTRLGPNLNRQGSKHQDAPSYPKQHPKSPPHRLYTVSWATPHPFYTAKPALPMSHTFPDRICRWNLDDWIANRCRRCVYNWLLGPVWKCVVGTSVPKKIYWRFRFLDIFNSARSTTSETCGRTEVYLPHDVLCV